jgi:hypothetical protein
MVIGDAPVMVGRCIPSLGNLVLTKRNILTTECSDDVLGPADGGPVHP